MKVLFVIDSLEGYGAEKSLVEIAVHLKKVTPVFVHLYSGNALRPILEDNKIKVYSLNIDAKYGYKEAVRQMTSIVEEEKPEIIHSTLFRADMIARRLKRNFPDIPLVGSFVSNSYCPSRYKQLSVIAGLKLLITQIRDRITAREVDYFISNSYTIKESNSRALGISKDKIEVIYRGRSLIQVQPPTNDSSKISKIKMSLGLTNQRIFFNVGRLQRGKGQADLIKSFKEISEKHSDVVLLIAGEGTYRRELEKLISKLNLQKKVQLLGYRDDISDLLQISDFFIFPTYYEGLPGALIEAIIAGKPLVISDIGENRECVPPGNALLFQPGNIKEMSAKMQEALQVKNWNKITEDSLRYAQKHFDIEKVSEQYESFYLKIAKNFDC